MAQPNESTSGDSDGRYRRKWDSIFNSDLYFDEELDYEYEYCDEDIDKSFPLGYTWLPSSSAVSSPSSSRLASPINLIDDDDDDEESVKARVYKKLTREFQNLVARKRESSPHYLRHNWKKNADFKGMLKRWRIRSLDLIFSFKQGLQVPERPMKQKVKRPIHHLGSSNTAVDPVSDLSIVVNNDLCTAVPDLPPSQYPTGSGEQTLFAAGNKPPDCDNNSSYPLMVMPQGLDMSLPNVSSRSQMTGSSERSQFLNKNVFEERTEPICDTIVRPVLQQPSQQRANRPVHPVSAISFKQILRHEPYNRPVRFGGQRIARRHIFSNVEEENGGQFSDFAATLINTNVFPPRPSLTPFPDLPDDEDLHPDRVFQSDVPVSSNSQMAVPSERSQFLNKNVLEARNEPVCDTILRTMLQQPSQQRSNRPARRGSSITFKHPLRHEPYNRPASVGGQRIVRPHIFSNIEGENGGQFNDFKATSTNPYVLPPRPSLAPFPNQPGDEDLDPDPVLQRAVPSSYSMMLMPQDLDFSVPNVSSSSQMAVPNERTQFWNKNVFEARNEPVCDTILRTVLQQPSQQRANRAVCPGSAINFKQILRHEPYNSNANVGGQRIRRPHVFSNIEEENGGQLSGFTAALINPNVLPPNSSLTPFPNQPDDEDLDPGPSRSSE